eukprot:TRINITY_DN4453_c0_g1_i2.p1 TRINITY_DN4453_c0_g1~~TRINITY_DN4453_c0_g1_i2.p1  ORF type:complete len:372 (-),score=113.57 TRINITY_DN4453_c0_g1_i2:461-1576(-)
MVEAIFEEAKDNKEDTSHERQIKEGSADIEEDKVYIDYGVVKEQVTEKDIEVEDFVQKRFRKQNCQQRRKKKKKHKEAKKESVAAFFKQVDLKVFNQTPMLPVEEYFAIGDTMPITKKGDFSLILKLMQTHFKATEDHKTTKSENPQFISEQNQKFYDKRYYLFSKYDQGIKLDEESWYSVTPEVIAEHIAKKCRCNCILDAFCGAGSNSIQFARYAKKVYANDVAASRLDIALHNARIYRVEEKISFVNKDFLVLDKVKDFDELVDLVFISPPWGGISYSKDLVYDLNQIKPNFREILRKALLLANNVVLFLPRNTDLRQLEELLLSYDSLYSDSNECFVTVEALIKGNANISALVVFIGPLFKVLLAST